VFATFSGHAVPRLSLIGLADQCYAAAYRALEIGDLTNAERLFAVMLASRPSDERGWLGLGVVGERRGAWRKAAVLYRIGCGIGADPAPCHLGLGRVLARLGRTRDAEHALDEAERRTNDRALLCAIERERILHGFH
jgi:cytochrome c-type biogenesis protein CcmH/NrfG